MTKELISRLYSSDEEVKRAAVYRVLFDRRCDLLPELKKAISFEKNEQVAVFMMQVVMTIEAFPRDASMERRILELLDKDGGASALQPSMWKYLCGYGTSSMLIAALGAMGEAIPPDALEFIDACINHPDPDVRAMACEKAIKSGRPTHFAYVLNLITDPDPLVAETAFNVIHSMPVNEMAIVLDYSLGSPDEWVLENVAPFLPNLINNGLRQVISKVQYHKHPLVSRKAREALKALDAIPYLSKKAIEEAEAAKAAAAAAATSAGPEAASSPAVALTPEKGPSFKEQMELKRVQKIEEERRRKEEEEAMAKELAAVKPEEIADFAGQLAGFDAVASGNVAAMADGDGLPAGEVAFIENQNFENETAVLDAIDENAAIEEPPPTVVPAELDLTAASELPEPVIVEIHDGELDLEGASQQIKIPGSGESAVAPLSSPTSPSAAAPVAAAPLSSSTSPSVTAPVVAPSVAAVLRPPAGLPQNGSLAGNRRPSPATEVARPGAAAPGPAREIITRYPSFLADPFARLFQPAKPDMQLKIINQTADNLIAFLNLCFLQSCMYYAQESDVLARSIRECLKGQLIGPTALRCLHNFALAMKAARGSPVFFTFSLAGILTDSSDSNPLMMLRELKEFLRDPVQPLEENVPQAIEGLTEILRGVKSILNNLLVMKAPPGAKEPFADLSGPEAKILTADKRPGLDLPVGEVILISRDGSEAFGLFPFFKYAKKKVVFARPDEREMAIIYERLEISPE